MINVLQAVVVEVTENDSKTASKTLRWTDQARRLGHIGELSVSVVVIEDSLFAFKGVGRASNRHFLQLARIGIFRPRGKMGRIKFDKICNIEIQQAVIVIVAEGRAHAPFGKLPMRVSHSRQLR